MSGPAKTIRRIVVVGGGTAGWMAAAALARALGGTDREIILIESDAIGTIGVGEATVPPIHEFNRYLRLDPDALMRVTNGTAKLGIEFAGWCGDDHRYFHPFGFLGVEMGGIHFHHYWRRHLATGGAADHGPLNLETMAARAGRFARGTGKGPVHHAIQFDAAAYAQLLRQTAESGGVRRIEGRVVDVALDPESGFIAGVTLEGDARVGGDFFIDCTGFRALLIGGALQSRYTDWRHWLPCDRAVALPCEINETPRPYTRATAREAGWQWTIPLQHRTGNGYVYSSAHLDADEAERRLRALLPANALANANHLRFTAGHRQRPWAANCVAIGLAAGFLEPLESTSIHLIQTAIIRLLALLPGERISPAVTERYNRDTVREYESIRDFVIAHYALASRDEPFWQDVAAAGIPDSLAERLAAFGETGNILFDPGDLFGPTNWYCVLIGQGLRPAAYHPIADGLPAAELTRRLDAIRAHVAGQLAELPSHAEWLKQVAGSQPPLFSSATTS